jgi:16S rRNA (cytosine1402-N4)-methyltransferase
LNEYSLPELQEIFGRYGEVRNAKTLANAIVSHRLKEEIATTDQLKSIAASFAPRGKEMKYYAQIFQALRIEVNDEMAALEEMLHQSIELLKKDGRLVIISYHSLEDRPVKNIMRYGNFEGIPNKDFFGNLVRPLEPVVRKPIVPGMEEITKNKRARSAKLRICKKI